jgi:ATP-dependent DNA helicase RecG
MRWRPRASNRPRTTASEAKELRGLHLIEGRSPKFFISAKVADTEAQKARYIHNRGLDDKYCQQLVLDYLSQYGQAARADLDALLLAKLSDVLSPQQKANKVKNLLQSMRRTHLIHPKGPRSAAVWFVGPDKASSVLDKS